MLLKQEVHIERADIKKVWDCFLTFGQYFLSAVLEEILHFFTTQVDLHKYSH